MTRMAWQWILAGTVLSAWGACGAADLAVPGGAGTSEKNIKEGFTLPFKRYELHFPTMGVIREVKVREGDVVNPGDVLLFQDDAEEQAELKILEFDANNRLPIDAAKASLEAKRVEFEAKDRLKKANHFVDLEWARAKAEMEIAAIQVKQAETELEQKKLKRDKQQQRVTNMKLVAKSKGVVQKVINELGSNVDPTKPSLIMVQNDPLLVEVQVPALASTQMKVSDTLRVSHDKKKWSDAKVSFMSPEADAGSGMRTVHLELPNADNQPSGLQIYVELPEKLMASGDR